MLTALFGFTNKYTKPLKKNDVLIKENVYENDEGVWKFPAFCPRRTVFVGDYEVDLIV